MRVRKRECKQKENENMTITEKIDKAFSPDVSFTWDTDFKCYVLQAITELGNAWFKHVYGIRMSRGKLIALPIFPEMYDSALNSQLTVTVIDNED